MSSTNTLVSSRDNSRRWLINEQNVVLESDVNPNQHDNDVMSANTRSNMAEALADDSNDVSTAEANVKDDADVLLDVMAPIFWSMKLAGQYFRRPRCECGASIACNPECSEQRRRSFNVSHIYSTIILVVLWINVIRMCSAFGSQAGFDSTTILRISVFSTFLQGAILQGTTCQSQQCVHGRP